MLDGAFKIANHRENAFGTSCFEVSLRCLGTDGVSNPQNVPMTEWDEHIAWRIEGRSIHVSSLTAVALRCSDTSNVLAEQ